MKTRRQDDSHLTDIHKVSPYNQLECEASYFFNITYMIILLTIRFEFNPRSKIKMITYGYLVKFCVIQFNSVYVCCAIIVFRQ